MNRSLHGRTELTPADAICIAQAKIIKELAGGRVEALMRLYGNGSRAVVKVNWQPAPKGHVFIAENQKQMVCFLDPQTGSMDVSRYFLYAGPASVVILRTDQRSFTGLAEQCLDTA